MPGTLPCPPYQQTRASTQGSRAVQWVAIAFQQVILGVPRHPIHVTTPAAERYLPTIDEMTPVAETSALLSVGYQERDIQELVALLVDNDVHILVDVRLNAISRKRGFSKTALAKAVTDAGIAYRHERELGNPKDNRESFRRGHKAARNRYLKHLSNGASAVYDEVVALASTSRVALLCYERVHSECHRSCIADKAQDGNPRLQVVEI